MLKVVLGLSMDDDSIRVMWNAMPFAVENETFRIKERGGGGGGGG